MKKISFVVVILLVFCLTSCGTREVAPADFSTGELTITLTNEFSYSASGDYTACFMSELSAVLVLRESREKFDSFEAMTLTDYAQAVLANNNKELPVKAEEGTAPFVSFSFEETVGDRVQYYFVCVYQSNEAFWTLQFMCDEPAARETKDSFVTWAKSVQFKESDN